MVDLQWDRILVPGSTACLGMLKSLALEKMELHSFSLSRALANKLVQLTKLSLAGTGLGELPSALSLITSLKTVDLSDCIDLQLTEKDAESLAALPELTSLQLRVDLDHSESWFGWSAANMEACIAIGRRLPQLQLVVR